jgi:MFS family permease
MRRPRLTRPAIPDLGPLHEPNFRLLWLGRSASMLGDSFGFVAMAFAVLAISTSGTDLGLVVATYSASSVTFLLVGGVVADRLPRRAVMIAADVVRGLAQLALAIAVLTGTATFPLFLVVAFLSGSATGFFQPASTALIPQAVSPERLQQGNAMLNLSGSSAQLIGPVLSGVLVATVGAGWVFAFDALTFAVSAVALASLRLQPTERQAHGSFLGDFKAGWREVTKRSWLPPSLVTFTFVNLAFAAFLVLGPIAMDATYGGARDWGFVVAMFGLGGLIGGGTALRWRPSKPLIAVFLLLALNPLRLLVLSATPPLLVVLAFVLIASASMTLGDTLWHTTLQQQVPSSSLSRVSSFDWMVSLLFFPVGAALAGPLADLLGPSNAMLAFAIVATIPCLLVVAVPSVRAVARRDRPIDEPASGAAGASTDPDTTRLDADVQLSRAS